MQLNKCKMCKVEFYRYLRKDKVPKFCSYVCRNKSYEKVKNLKCEQCKGEFSDIARKMSGKRRFCSQDCTNEWKKIAYKGRRVEYVLTECNHCSEKIERMPSKINDKNYCNKSCAAFDKVEKMSISPKTRKYKVFLKDGSEIFVRSTWEAVFIKDYLEKYDFSWKYEPNTFTLSSGNKYTPDFYIEDDDVWVEIKGYDYRGHSIDRANLFRDGTGENLLYLNENALKSIFKLNLKRSYLESVVEVVT